MTANDTANRELFISRLLNAPRQLVWEAWTNPAHIAQWWGPEGFTNTIHQMDVSAGGEWHFIMHGPDGTDYKNKVIYIEVVAPERIVYDHISTPKFRVWVHFEAQGEKTLLTMRSQFESAEALKKVIEVFKADVGMKQNIDRMQAYAENMQHSSVQKNVAGPIVVEQVYNAPVSLVWKALTDREQMKQWYFDIAAFRAEPGFEFRFTGGAPDGTQYLHICVIKEVIENKRLSYSWRYDGYAGDSLVTFDLFDEAGKTRVRLTHAGLETFPANPDFARKNFEGGWNEIVGRSLKNFVEQV